MAGLHEPERFGVATDGQFHRHVEWIVLVLIQGDVVALVWEANRVVNLSGRSARGRRRAADGWVDDGQLRVRGPVQAVRTPDVRCSATAEIKRAEAIRFETLLGIWLALIAKDALRDQ